MREILRAEWPPGGLLDHRVPSERGPRPEQSIHQEVARRRGADQAAVLLLDRRSQL